jgi:hypothetical protein
MREILIKQELTDLFNIGSVIARAEELCKTYDEAMLLLVDALEKLEESLQKFREGEKKESEVCPN